MKVSQASKIWLDYHRAHSKHNTIRAYKFTITKFNQNFLSAFLFSLFLGDIKKPIMEEYHFLDQ